MFKYLWILMALVLVSVFVYFLYNVIKEAVDEGNTNIEDIIEYIGCYHENVAVALGVMFVFLCIGLLALFIGSIIAFGKYYGGNSV